LPHGHHVANGSPPQQKNLIRTKSQMINICKGKMRGLVSSGMKFQTTLNYRDEMHI